MFLEIITLFIAMVFKDATQIRGMKLLFQFNTFIIFLEKGRHTK